jgi:RNA polymerase sigma-70 factor (ECF subfamily)
MSALEATDRVANAHAVFDGLWERRHAEIYRYCAHMTDPQRGADLTQDVFLDAFRALLEGRFDGENEQGWLFKSASRKAFDRRRYGWGRYVFGSLERLFPEFFASTVVALRSRPWGREYGAQNRAGEAALTAPRRWAEPEPVLLEREQAAAVAEAIRHLRPNYRAVLWLREWEGLDYDEISHAMGITRASTKSMLFKARARFREVWLKGEQGVAA